MLKVGHRAPYFDLLDDRDGHVTLDDLVKDGLLLLYFYPADFTPLCTKQACMLRDIHTDVARAGIRVAGISPQDSATHSQFRKENKLPFLLLADPEKAAIHAYGVDGPFGLGVRRVTYLISQEKKILNVLVADLLVSRHETFAREAIEMAAR